MTTENTPTSLAEIDRLNLVVLQERGGRLKAELAVLESQQQQVRAALTRWQIEQQAFGNTLREKYALDPGDQVNTETGEIARTTKPAEAAPV